MYIVRDQGGITVVMKKIVVSLFRYILLCFACILISFFAIAILFNHHKKTLQIMLLSFFNVWYNYNSQQQKKLSESEM